MRRRISLVAVIALLSGLLAVLAAPAAHADIDIKFPVADSYVDAQNKTTNFGGSQALLRQASPSSKYKRTFVQFSNEHAGTGELWLTDSTATSGTIVVKAVSSNWCESPAIPGCTSPINWNNQPVATSTVGTLAITGPGLHVIPVGTVAGAPGGVAVSFIVECSACSTANSARSREYPTTLARPQLATTYIPPPPPPSNPTGAEPGEAMRTDDWVSTTARDKGGTATDDNDGWDLFQGYSRVDEASYWKGGFPDCLVTTGKGPVNASDPYRMPGGPGAGAHYVPNTGFAAPTGLSSREGEDAQGVPAGTSVIDQSVHVIGNVGPTDGTDENKETAPDGTRDFNNFSYWVHTQQDIDQKLDGTDNDKWICGRAVVSVHDSTDGNDHQIGQFHVSFPRPLASSPAAVVFSPAYTTADGGGAIGGRLVESMDANGFNGRLTDADCGTIFDGDFDSNCLWRGNGTLANKVVINYWAVVDQSRDVAFDPAEGPYWHRAGTALVVTDSTGTGTIDFPNFTGGNSPTGIQVTGYWPGPFGSETCPPTCVIPAVTGNASLRNTAPARLAVSNITDNDATVHAWMGQTACQVDYVNPGGPYCDGRIKNTEIAVNYIVSGPTGGARRPWHMPSGNPSDTGFVQLAGDSNVGNPPDLTCGENAIYSPADFLWDGCSRYWQHEGNVSGGNGPVKYMLEPSFTALGPAFAGAADPDVVFRAAADNWATIDSSNPNLVETTVPSETKYHITAAQLAEQICADNLNNQDVVPGQDLWNANGIDGLNYHTSSVFRHNTNPLTHWANPPLQPGFVGCGQPGVYRHEIGHFYGLGHDMEPGSIMNSQASHSLATLQPATIESFKSMYGHSGSAYARGAKVSDLVHASPGTSIGVIKVTGRGKGRLNQTKAYALQPVTGEHTSWVGSVPATVHVIGGRAGNKITLPSEGKSPGEFKPGTSWVVQVRDSDGELLQAFPIIGGKVHILPEIHAQDDIDGGDPLVVGLAELRGEARRR